MPTYISRDGVVYPAKERIGLRNNSDKTIINPSSKDSKFAGEKVGPKEHYIYEGPDRAAALELFKAGVKTFGQDFRTSPDFLQSVRNQGYDNPEKYLELLFVFRLFQESVVPHE